MRQFSNPRISTINEVHDMDEQRIRSIIESVLLVSDRPLPVKEITDILGGVLDSKGVRKVLEDMAVSYQNAGSGILLREVAGGFQFYTNPENAEFIKRMIDIKPFKLSRAALETLAIVAYRQPVTKAEIEEIRGVDSSGAIRVLIEKKFVRIVGKKDEPGRPFLYGTTKEFMEFFDLKSLSELPTLKDLEQIAREINEESGVADTSSNQPAIAEMPQKIELDSIAKEEIQEVADEQEVKEEVIANQFEEALKRVEQTNKAIKESIGLSENIENSESSDGSSENAESLQPEGVSGEKVDSLTDTESEENRNETEKE